MTLIMITYERNPLYVTRLHMLSIAGLVYVPRLVTRDLHAYFRLRAKMYSVANDKIRESKSFRVSNIHRALTNKYSHRGHVTIDYGLICTGFWKTRPEGKLTLRVTDPLARYFIKYIPRSIVTLYVENGIKIVSSVSNIHHIFYIYNNKEYSHEKIRSRCMNRGTVTSSYLSQN